MLRAVLDTDVFVSGLKNRKTPPGQILQLWRKNKLIVITSPQLLAEIHEVFMRPSILSYLNQTPAIMDEFIKLLIRTTFVTAQEFIEVLNNS